MAQYIDKILQRRQIKQPLSIKAPTRILRAAPDQPFSPNIRTLITDGKQPMYDPVGLLRRGGGHGGHGGGHGGSPSSGGNLKTFADDFIETFAGDDISTFS